MTIPNFILVLTGVLLNAIAQLSLKAGTNAIGVLNLSRVELFNTVMQLVLQPYIIGGIVCYVFSVAIWIVALSKLDVSIAYPMLSIGYVLNAFAAWYLFGEVITYQKFIGIIIIIIGVYFVARS